MVYRLHAEDFQGLDPAAARVTAVPDPAVIRRLTVASHAKAWLSEYTRAWAKPVSYIDRVRGFARDTGGDALMSPGET
jgi:hypothetical protein